MANSLDVRIVEDGWRHAVARLIGFVDTTDLNQKPALSLSQFTNNAVGMKFNGLRFVGATFVVTNAMSVILEWDGNTIQPMASLSGAWELDFRRNGGYGPDRSASGYNGNINLRTAGFIAGNKYVFTVLLRMTKMYST